MTQYRNQVQYLNAVGAIDPRMLQCAGYQSPNHMIAPVLSGMPGSQMTPHLRAHPGHLQHHFAAQLPQTAAFVQAPMAQGQSIPANFNLAQPLAQIGAMAGLFGEQQPVTFCPDFEGSDVYIANQGVIVGRKEKRYVRIRWGDGQKGHKARWVGFAPSDWKMNHPLATDPQLLGFYVKPNLCDRSNKSKRNSGWVTLSIDCAHRAIKATIDGWTLGKVFIPTWLIGRVMRPVAVSEAGMPVKFDLQTEEGCEKVLRAGFQKWSTIKNSPLYTMRCMHTNRNFETDVLGMSLDVSFDEAENLSGVRDCQDGYISYDAVDKGLASCTKEIIPLVINDRHAFRAKERGLWKLFYADGRVPLDYLSERMTALIRKIYEAKHHNNRDLYRSAVTKLAHFRHILFFLAKNQKVVEDANSRVQWFLSNTSNSGVHKEFTPDLGRLLTCVAVSDYEWEDIAVPFFAEALQRALPHAMADSPRVQWSGPDANLDDIFDALMVADKSLSEMLLHVIILTKVMKPHHKQLDEIVIERLSAEELCCGIAGLSAELHVLEYERSVRKDEIKKCLIKREWQHDFKIEQWKLIEGVLDSPVRLRGMLNRSRMIAECHGSCGLPTPEMFAAIDEAFELGKTVEDFKEYLECYNIAHPGRDAMFSIVKKAVVMATRKGYITPGPLAFEDEEGLLSARQALTLTPSGSEILSRQGRPSPVYQPEVLPSIATPAGPSTTTPGGGFVTAGNPSAEGEEASPASRTTPPPGHQAGEPTLPAAHSSPVQTPANMSYMQFPVLMNNSSDPVQQPFLLHNPSPSMGGAGQYQYVQVMPTHAPLQTSLSPGSVATSAYHQPQTHGPSPATTPGSVRLGFPTPTGPNNNQMLMSQTPRNPLSPSPSHPTSMFREGENSYSYLQSQMRMAPPATRQSQEGQTQYYTMALNGVLVQV